MAFLMLEPKITVYKRSLNIMFFMLVGVRNSTKKTVMMISPLI